MDNTHPAQDDQGSLSNAAHALTWNQVVEELQTNVDEGLSSSEIQQRLETTGRNELDDDSGVNPGKILLRQIANAMTLVLIIAMAVSFGIQSYIEGGVIAGVIFIVSKPMGNPLPMSETIC